MRKKVTKEHHASSNISISNQNIPDALPQMHIFRSFFLSAREETQKILIPGSATGSQLSKIAYVTFQGKIALINLELLPFHH